MASITVKSSAVGREGLVFPGGEVPALMGKSHHISEGQVILLKELRRSMKNKPSHRTK